MRIISKQKDFYDHVMSFGVDPGIVYVREPKKHHFNRHKETGPVSPFLMGKLEFRTVKTNERVNFWCVHVIICGKAYRFFYRQGMPNVPFQNREAMFEAEPCVKPISNFWYGDDWHYNTPYPNLERDWSEVNRHFDSPIVVVGMDYNSPYKDQGSKGFIYDHTIVNEVFPDSQTVLTDAPVLSMMGLASHIDATDIWMKVSNWCAETTKETVEISDKSKIVKAGLDPVKSFRNMKRD